LTTKSVSYSYSLVFDLDGTLIDSVPDVSAALNRMLGDLGAPPLSVKEVQSTVGDGAAVMIERALVAAGQSLLDIDLTLCYERYLRYYREQPVVGTTVYPGVRDVLTALKAQGIAMGICTNKPSIMTALVLEKLDLDQYFKAVAAGEDTPFKKPDGRHVALTLSLMGVRDRQAIMVGDSEADINAARDFGIPSIAVTYGYSKRGARSLNADILIDKFAELPGAIFRLIARTG
jgi:phosphoglycolate phosphatase